MNTRTAKFSIGQLVRHRTFPIRGVIVDVDAEFGHGDAWWTAMPEDERPDRDQPFYHVIAEGLEDDHSAYVSEQNLLEDRSGEPIRNPEADRHFAGFKDGRYRIRPRELN